MAAAAGILQAIVGIGQIGISATQLAREGRAMRRLRENLKDVTVPSTVTSSYVRAKKAANSGLSQESKAAVVSAIKEGRSKAIDSVTNSGSGAAAQLASTLAINEGTNKSLTNASLSFLREKEERERYADKMGLNLANYQSAVEDANMKRLMAKYGMSTAGMQAWAEMGAAGADNLAGGIYMASEENKEDKSVFKDYEVVGENANPSTREQLGAGIGKAGIDTNSNPNNTENNSVNGGRVNMPIPDDNAKNNNAASVVGSIMGGDLQNIIKTGSNAIRSAKGKDVVKSAAEQKNKSNERKSVNTYHNENYPAAAKYQNDRGSFTQTIPAAEEIEDYKKERPEAYSNKPNIMNDADFAKAYRLASMYGSEVAAEYYIEGMRQKYAQKRVPKQDQTKITRYFKKYFK